VRRANTRACTIATNSSKNQNGRESNLPNSNKLAVINTHKYDITPISTIQANIFQNNLRESEAIVDPIHTK